jgi:hypothetical protein
MPGTGGEIIESNGRGFVLHRRRLLPIAGSELQAVGLRADAVTAGVGDRLSVELEIENLTAASLPAGTALSVRGLLTRDRMLGNGDDVFMDEVVVELAQELGEGEVRVLDLEFQVPELQAGGDFHIGAVFRARGIDLHSHNNLVITEGATVHVPEWHLGTVTSGEGEIARDFLSLRYPHQSRVSMTAQAGKGAVFGGWGGDALGTESQITILMNGDKTIEAEFSPRVGLQVFVVGSGQVMGQGELGLYQVGSTASLTAEPADGWVFAGWSGAATGAAPQESVLMDGAKSVTARFERPRAQWRQLHFSTAQLQDPSISADDADPDGDGVENWKEYLMASNPMDRQSRGRDRPVLEGGFLSLIYTRLAAPEAGMGMECRASRDLGTWDAPDLQQRVLRSEDGVETVEARIPYSADTPGFLRFDYRR